MHAQRCRHRGEELLRMGCQALEITLDTKGIEVTLPHLVAQAKMEGVVNGVNHNKDRAQAVIGVGTVMFSWQVEIAARLGAAFALSPINPPGFVQECNRWGIVAVPGVFTPNEVSFRC